MSNTVFTFDQKRSITNQIEAAAEALSEIGLGAGSELDKACGQAFREPGILQKLTLWNHASVVDEFSIVGYFVAINQALMFVLPDRYPYYSELTLGVNKAIVQAQSS